MSRMLRLIAALALAAVPTLGTTGPGSSSCTGSSSYHELVVGCPRNESELLSQCANDNSFAGVQCCLEDNSTQGFCLSYCDGDLSYEDAKSFCAINERRLCTYEEFTGNECCATRCDNIWLKDECGDNREHNSVTDGCKNQNTEVGDACLSVEDEAAIRCCSKDASSNFCDSFCGGVSHTLANYATAVATCEANGLRLCTREEIDNRDCCSSGCQFDGHQTWILEQCFEPISTKAKARTRF